MLTELIVLRHARAAPASAADDRERPLTPQGVVDAERVGTVLADSGVHPTRILTSPAARALQTTAGLARAFPGVDIRHEEGIYEGTPGELLELLARHSDAESVVLVGHNPGVSELASELATGRSAELRSLPTCGYVRLKLRAAGVLEPGAAELQEYGTSAERA